MPAMRLLLACFLFASATFAQDAATSPPSILINKNFEGGSLGKVEKLGEAQFRLHVEGQYDERGRNRQASWYFFRMENVAGRDLVLTITDLAGEYNDKPGTGSFHKTTNPVFSYDGKTWDHFPAMEWNDAAQEATVKFRAEQNVLWVARIAPYTHSDLLRLLGELDRFPHARIEAIGKTVQGRDLHMVTVTDFSTPDEAKKLVWLQSRQHAWEAGTSYVSEGALRFITSDDERARELRRRVIFKFTPMMDPDGCASGRVRFNANGYDVNRHWDEVDLRDKEKLRQMPEIWYVKRALFAQMDSGKPIDLMINMHNEDTGEWMGTQVDDPPTLERLQRLFHRLSKETTFDPHRLTVSVSPGNSTNVLWKEKRIPVALTEQRIGPSQKLGRQPTVADRIAYGAQLITQMAQTVLE
jgi:hypothetical protein